MADMKAYRFYTNLDLIFYSSFGVLGINQILFSGDFEKENENFRIW